MNNMKTKNQRLTEFVEANEIDLRDITRERLSEMTGENVSQQAYWILRRQSKLHAQNFITRKGRSVISVSQASGIEYQTLSRWARRGIPAVHEIAALCTELGMTIQELSEEIKTTIESK